MVLMSPEELFRAAAKVMTDMKSSGMKNLIDSFLKQIAVEPITLLMDKSSPSND